MKVNKSKTVDEFVSEAPVAAQPALEQIRKVMKQAVPDVEETMGYGKPYFKYHGWMTGVTLYTKHLGVEIWDGLSDDDRQELEALGYHTGIKNFRIQYDQEVPVALLARLVKAQARRNQSKDIAT